MCGRFTLIHDIKSIAQAFHVPVPATMQIQPHYNVAPAQNIVTLMQNKDEEQPHLDMLRWGLVPSWAKDESIGNRMINARAETLAEKPSFKRLLHNKRCLIVADGFYEWKSEPGAKTKTPMYFTLENDELFTFAGLWDTWRNPEGEQIRTCTIITTNPNTLVSPVHNRMPTILPAEAREEWLNPQHQDEQALLHLLCPYDATEMKVRPVSRLVNNTNNDSPEILEILV
jgi:putative SOS response-associated peptidase YedK